MSETAHRFHLPRAFVYFLIFGLYLTLRGYHSRDGDQAYRLPLLLHRQDPALFANDPFVRAFDTFNPHRGSLTLIDAASHPFGLSAGLAALFALTFAVTCFSLDRLARAVWPEVGPNVGLVAVCAILAARAGNIGTNQLFEPILLDRLMGFALGWLALTMVIERPERCWWAAPVPVGLATLIHPSVGLQLALLMGATWIIWGVWAKWTGVGATLAARGLVALSLAILPGLAILVGQGDHLWRGLTPEEFRLLSVELQGPQHMLPHLWRLPQWLAWGCYPVLAVLSLGNFDRVEEPSIWPSSRVRLAIVLVVNLTGLAIAWVVVEGLHDLRVTLFQPFRMATIARGLALVVLSGRLLRLWRRGAFADRARAALLVVGLAGDWSLVIVTAFEVTVAVIKAARARWLKGRDWIVFQRVVSLTVLGLGLAFLMRHDTESGHLPLLGALGGLLGWTWAGRNVSFRWNRRRLALAMTCAWAVPLAALVAGCLPRGETGRSGPWVDALVGRCRFAAIPTDDIERLAVWCRDHTPPAARFIGPPGPKTFRLWSLRSLAFNRSGSPYHAEGLADWSARFRDHVGFQGTMTEFVRAYLADRPALENRYQAMTEVELANLATRQHATHVVAGPFNTAQAAGHLELLHVEGRYAVYRVVEMHSPQRHKDTKESN